MTTSKYYKLRDSKFINISGADRSTFLQSLITNDINKCDPKTPIYSCLLSPQGKFIADFFIINCIDSYLIEIHKNFFDDFLKKIDLYKLQAKIKVKNLESFKSLFLIKNNNFFEKEENIFIFDDPRKNDLGIKIYVKKNNIDEFINKYSLIENDFDKYRELLIKNLIPYSTEDLVKNKSLLLENNFENLNAIDWNKGCYIGQEITARMKYRALLKKSIKSVEVIEGNINTGDRIFLEKNNIGEVISSFKNFGIAMLNIEQTNEVIKKNINLKTDSADLKIMI